jgi:hypothetical protein
MTDIKLTKDNIEEVMHAVRSRWRIENCTFNTLKNQGYNFGHGHKELCSIMGMMMILALIIDQISELFDDHFQKATVSNSR